MTLRVAIIDGPMYSGLYETFADHDVEIVVRADHPTLNRRVATMLAAGERIDVISTHSKYVPSQRAWLRELDVEVETSALAPRAMELCCFAGVQYCVPRNIDVRVLWANRRLVDLDEVSRPEDPARPEDAADRLTAVPTTWPGLAGSGLSFGFPGRESGLFGTFFEVVTALGGTIFDDALRPSLDSDVALDAIECLRVIASNSPDALSGWHYDDVDAALGTGQVALAAAWPGAATALRRSSAGPDLRPFPYLGGARGVRSYAGCHAWAIPTTCGDVDGAEALINELCGYGAQSLDARSGSVCAHVEAFADAEVVDDVDARRRTITAATIADGMITYPPMERFPEIEAAGWSAIRAVLVGECAVADAASAMQAAAEQVLR